MSCCDETTARVPDTDVSRRSLFKGAALIASVIPAARPTRSEAQGKQIRLAYCSQLLCGVPYEVARSAGSSRITGSMCKSSIPAAAMPRCRRWSAAPSTMPPPRWTLPPGLCQCRRGHPPLCGHRPPPPVRRCHRSQDREPDSIDQGPGGKDGRRLRARQCRSRADALPAEASRRRRPESPVRDHGRQSAGSVAAEPDRRRPGAGARFDPADGARARACS